MLCYYYYIHLHILKSINCIISCNIVPYLYLPHVILLNILYIHLQILKCINCVINCNIVPYSYCPYFMFLHILYIHIQTFKNVLTVLLNVIMSHIHISLTFSYYISCIYIYSLSDIYIDTHARTDARARPSQNPCFLP